MSTSHKETTPTVKEAAAKPVMVPRGSVLITNLPANTKDVYGGIIQCFFNQPSAQRSHNHNHNSTSNSQPPSKEKTPAPLWTKMEAIDETDNATLLLEVPNQQAAKRLFGRLQNVKCCGRKWKVRFLPISQAQCRAEPCLARCVLEPPAPPHIAEEALRSIPGYLATTKAAESAGDTNSEEASEALTQSVFASFCDEGSALHARAVLSGRLIGSSGVRMFVEPPLSTTGSA